MARSRNIKPGFFSNELLVDLPFEYRLLFIGLWTLADKKGRLEDRPKKIKMAIFPCDDVDTEKGIALLNRDGFVKQYSVEGVDYIQIVNWERHQSPHHTEKESSIPSLDNVQITVKPQNINSGNPPDSLIPDSLIPDSLIPDSLIPDSLEKQAPDKPAKFSALDFLLEQGVREPVCKDWLSLRKQKRSPPTLTAIKGIQAEAQKAGITLDAALTHCCERGWQGFKAEWITKPSPNPVAYMTAAQQSRETIAALTGGLKNGTEERDITSESIRIA